MIEILFVLLLVLLNGVFAGAELAIVSSRKSRLQALADAGSARARAALALRAEPERFLASVQVGITTIGAVAGAFGGAALAKVLEPWFRALPGLEPAAEELAFVTVVAVITYLSVVFGELVPKSLALRAAEPYALLIARPMQLLAWIGRPVVWLLAASANAVLKLFGDHTSFLEGKLSREDLESVVHEARAAGSLDPATSRLMTRALDFARLRVDDVMVHRRSIVAVPRSASGDELRQAMLTRGHRRIPVYGTSIDDIVGYVLREDVLASVWNGKPVDVEALLRQPFVVPEAMPAGRTLHELQARKLPIAIVVDEHGGTSGLVTIEDLVEELVGELLNEHDFAGPDVIQADGDDAFLVQGNVDVRDLAERLGIRLPELRNSRTLGGAVVELAGGRLPKSGEKFVFGACELEAIDVSPRRVRQVRVRPQRLTPRAHPRS